MKNSKSHFNGATAVPVLGCAVSKLTVAQVKEIRAFRTYGILSEEIAPWYNITSRTIRDVLARKTWKHVE